MIDWHASNKLGKAVDEIIENAHKYVKSQNYAKALPIIFAVIEGMCEPLYNSDDSSGSIGGCIDGAVYLLRQTANECSQPDIQRTVFEACVKYFKRELYKGFDWYRDFIEIAATLVDNNNDFATIMHLLDQPQDSEYTVKHLQTVKFKLLKQFKGDAEAERYLETNIANSDLRKQAIELAISKQDYAKAIRLAHDGIENDKIKYPGLVCSWYEYLLKVAQAQKDTPKIIEYARHRLIDNFSPEQDYYKILKETVEPQQWLSFFDGMIEDFKKSKHCSTYSIADLYVKEEMWDRLFALVNENQTFSFIEHYETYLAENYSDQLSTMYANLILKYMEYNMSRSHYQNACRYIRRMIKLGARTKADKVIAKLRSLYPKRKALMEELERV